MHVCSVAEWVLVLIHVGKSLPISKEASSIEEEAKSKFKIVHFYGKNISDIRP